MIERLALPGWKVVDTPLSAWADQFRSLGFDAALTRESPNVSWIEIPALRLRGYAVLEDGRSVEAINFELRDDDLETLKTLDQAAAALSWELHEDEDDEVD